MTVLITAIRLNPPSANSHQRITNLRWQQGTDTGILSRAQLVDWLRRGNHAYVDASPRMVEVFVVDGTPPYVRTVADGYYSNNLLSLPRF